jgi:protein O-mannosyl-transferase
MRKVAQAEKRTRVQPEFRWRPSLLRAWIPLGLSVLAFGIFSRSLFCGFIRDDHQQIVDNPQVHSWHYLPQILTSHLWSHVAGNQAFFYRPLFSLWMLVIYTLGGLDAWFWHLSSILLHVACTCLVYFAGRRLLGSEVGASVAAALFAVHPIHVDAVSWVSASNEVLFSGLILSAVMALAVPNPGGWGALGWVETRLAASETGRARSLPRIGRRQVLLSAALYFAALFAKETGITLSLLLIPLAWVWLKSEVKHPRERILLATVPFAAATVIYLLARWSALHGSGIGQGEHSWREVVFSSPSTLLFYLGKLALPVGLSGGYVNAIYSAPTLAFWLALGAALAGIGLMTFLALRQNPVFGISAALILLPLLPALAAMRVYPQGDMVHDRYLYLSSAGFCLLIALLVQRAVQSARARTAAMCVLAIGLGVFAILTFRQQRFYHDDFSFVQREIEVNPRNAFAYAMLGNLYMDEHQADLGLQNLRKAHDLAPGEPKVSLFLARALFAEQKYDEAEALLASLLLQEDLDTNRKNGIRVSLANVEMSLKKLDSAETLLREVERSDPNLPELHWALGSLYLRQGNIPQAQAQFEAEYQLTGDPAAQRQSMLLARKILLQGPRNSKSESNHP